MNFTQDKREADRQMKERPGSLLSSSPLESADGEKTLKHKITVLYGDNLKLVSNISNYIFYH